MVMAQLLAFCGLVTTAFAAKTADIILSLGGDDWTVDNGTSPHPASVPGSVYVDLMAAGVIGDPYYGTNPDDYKWVGTNNTWTYNKTFTVSADMMKMRVIQLISEGLDSYATVSINDQLIFTNDNMYQRNFVEIKKFLHKGTNTISIAFRSKTEWAEDTAKTRMGRCW